MRAVTRKNPVFMGAASFVILAVMLRALIPAGFMPDMNAQGKLFPLVLCSSATGTATIYLPAEQIPGHEKETPPPPVHDDHAPCAFSFTAMAFADAPPALTAPVFEKQSGFPLPRPHIYVAAVRTYLPQGPPSV